MRKPGNLSREEREEWITRRRKEGYGCGEFETYKPWIDNYSFSSIGRSGNSRGNKIRRNFELLSDLERYYFYILDYSKRVVDIREQYPLFDRELVYQIAEEFGIKAPRYVGSKVIYVMTTDFYLLVKESDEIRPAVRTIKYSGELKDERVLEKLALEQEYFKRKGVSDWKIITEETMDPVVIRNLKFFRNFFHLESISDFIGLNNEETRKIVEEFKQTVPVIPVAVRDVCKSIDKTYGAGSGVKVYKHLLAQKSIDFDLKVLLSRDDYIVNGKGGLRVISGKHL